MRRLAFLTAFSMMALFVFAPAAFAQEEAAEIVEQQSAGEQGKADEKADEKGKADGKGKMKAKEMPKTGGMSVGSALLPAAGLLLLGSSVLVFAALRRR